MALIDVKQVQKILGIPESSAYKVISDLGKEMRSKGFYVLRGKIEHTYLLKRFGIPDEGLEMNQYSQQFHQIPQNEDLIP